MTAKEMFEQIGYEFEKEYTSDGANDTYRYNKCSGPTDSVIFDLNGEQIVTNQTFHTISLRELQAIIQQCKELGWLEEENSNNLLALSVMNYYECSNCGIILEHYKRIVVDEDGMDEFSFDYRPKYCPNCGRKIVD